MVGREALLAETLPVRKHWLDRKRCFWMRSLLNEKVSHNKFGAGIIVEEDGWKIKVQFSEMKLPKMFGFPIAFEKFLVLADEGLQGECHALALEKRREMDLEEKERLDEIARIAEEKRQERLEAMKLKRRASAKRAASAKKR